MKLTIAGNIVAEGEYADLAAYTAMTLELLKIAENMREKDNARKEADVMSQLLNLSFEQLRKKEMEDDREE